MKHDLDVIRQAIEERDDAIQKLDLLASEMVYRGNSVQHWHAKATAYGDCIMRLWKIVNEAGIKRGPGDSIEHIVQRLANLAGCERCGGSGWLESTDERGGQVMEPCGHGDWESLEIADGYSDEDLSRLDTTADNSTVVNCQRCGKPLTDGRGGCRGAQHGNTGCAMNNPPTSDGSSD